jgi:hypothetical protein
MDISRIESRFLRENQLAALGFPRQGFLFFRCTGVEEIDYHYNEVPGTIAANTWADSARLTMSAYSIDNILRVEDCDHVYQVFMGWKPGVVRQYLYYPFDTPRRNLDVKKVYTKSPFGYIDGFESEYDKPSPKTELFIPKDVEVGFGWWNPSSEPVDVEMNILIRRMTVEMLRDVDLVEKILTNKQPCRLVSPGGIGADVGFHPRDMLNIDFVPLGANRPTIEAALSK